MIQRYSKRRKTTLSSPFLTYVTYIVTMYLSHLAISGFHSLPKSSAAVLLPCVVLLSGPCPGLVWVCVSCLAAPWAGCRGSLRLVRVLSRPCLSCLSVLSTLHRFVLALSPAWQHRFPSFHRFKVLPGYVFVRF